MDKTKEMLEMDLDREIQNTESLLARIEDDPADYASKQAQKIEASINGRKGGPGPIRHRQPTHKGNISMRQHLENLKAEWEMEPRKSGILDRELDRRRQHLDSAKQRRSELEAK